MGGCCVNILVRGGTSPLRSQIVGRQGASRAYRSVAGGTGACRGQIKAHRQSTQGCRGQQATQSILRSTRGHQELAVVTATAWRGERVCGWRQEVLASDVVVMGSAREQSERMMGAEEKNGPKYFDANGDKSDIWPKTREKGKHWPNIWPQQDEKGQN